MPNNQALQVFYGTIPLILIIAGVWLREQMLLKDILARLRSIEGELGKVREVEEQDEAGRRGGPLL